MQRFESFIINENIAPANLDRAALLIARYLRKNTPYMFFRYPGVEGFSGKIKGFGVRFYSTKKNVSVRFNWRSLGDMGLVGVHSVDFWNGKEKASTNLEFGKGTSIVQILPMVAQMVSDGGYKSRSKWTLPPDDGLKEDTFLVENVDPENMVDDILDMIASPNFVKSRIYPKHRSPGVRIFDYIMTTYPSLFVKDGIKYKWTGSPKDLQKLKKEKDNILAGSGAVRVKISKGASNEKYQVDSAISALESQRERITFEKQLLDLENLIKLTVKGASNALFIAGRGGVGKTHTTEKVLGELGLRDGTGYFKNTGSATAAGMYSLLFKYRDDIILFDDSDDALKDQESRNILKAATDTKKVRKLVWNKMGKNIVDPDEMSADEMLEAGLLPRFFEFTGRIIFISNLKMDKLDPDGALRTRAFIIDIDPTEIEVYDFMEKIVGDIPLEEGLSLDTKSRLHVIELLRKGGSKQSANLRKLSRGLNMAAGAQAAGVSVGDSDLARMIETYA
jgi:hypothetical protein